MISNGQKILKNPWPAKENSKIKRKIPSISPATVRCPEKDDALFSMRAPKTEPKKTAICKRSKIRRVRLQKQESCVVSDGTSEKGLQEAAQPVFIRGAILSAYSKKSANAGAKLQKFTFWRTDCPKSSSVQTIKERA